MAALGVGEIIAIVTVTAQLVASAEKVAEIFDSIHNAPKSLRKLYRSVKQLEGNFKDLEEALRDSSPIKSSLDERSIKETLEEGERLFQDCESTLRQGPWGNVVWTILRARRVNEYRSELDHLYIAVFHPAWLQLSQ